MTISPEARHDIAMETARILIEVGAIQFNVERPFMFSSGLASPVYIDCRRLISYPQQRARLMDHATQIIAQDIGLDQVDAVAGGETAGIPFAAWIAANLQMPMHYVRKRPKGYGANARIEGVMAEDEQVVLIEDLTTDGGSKLRFCKSLRDAGAKVSHCVMIFYYDIFPQTRAILREQGLELHALANWRDILAALRESDPIPRQDLSQLRAFLNDPLDWSLAHGGAAKLVI